VGTIIIHCINDNNVACFEQCIHNREVLSMSLACVEESKECKNCMTAFKPVSSSNSITCALCSLIFGAKMVEIRRVICVPLKTLLTRRERIPQLFCKFFKYLPAIVGIYFILLFIIVLQCTRRLLYHIVFHRSLAGNTYQTIFIVSNSLLQAMVVGIL